MGRRATPEVNAGSMADIAFLLLIFFLVTTTIEKDKGIARQLPPKQDEQPPVDIKEKNIFVVTVNKEDQILADNELMDIQDIRQAAISFLDNGGEMVLVITVKAKKILPLQIIQRKLLSQ